VQLEYLRIVIHIDVIVPAKVNVVLILEKMVIVNFNIINADAIGEVWLLFLVSMLRMCHILLSLRII